MPDVIVKCEFGVVYPNRTSIVGNPVETLAIAGDVLKFGSNMITDSTDVDSAVSAFERCCIEEGHTGDMHVARPRLQREERCVQVAEWFVMKVAQGRAK